MSSPPLGRRLRSWLGAARRLVRSLPYRGRGRSCPVCEKSSRRFLPHGDPPRPEAKCPRCDSLERHRLAWLYLRDHTDLLDGGRRRVLHFAPERCLEPRLRRALGASYVTADLTHSGVDVIVDVSDIDYPDASFDVIICSHVLEHVPDDRRAMRELARVVAEDGWLMLMVPIRGEHTQEDPGIVDPAERMREFGQADHVRRYGEDFTDRLRRAGLEVTSITTADVVSSEESEEYGLSGWKRRIFIATRSSRNVQTSPQSYL